VAPVHRAWQRGEHSDHDDEHQESTENKREDEVEAGHFAAAPSGQFDSDGGSRPIEA
jgi:hypothetical protein